MQARRPRRSSWFIPRPVHVSGDVPRGPCSGPCRRRASRRELNSQELGDRRRAFRSQSVSPLIKGGWRDASGRPKIGSGLAGMLESVKSLGPNLASGNARAVRHRKGDACSNEKGNSQRSPTRPQRFWRTVTFDRPSTDSHQPPLTLVNIVQYAGRSLRGRTCSFFENLLYAPQKAANISDLLWSCFSPLVGKTPASYRRCYASRRDCSR